MGRGRHLRVVLACMAMTVASGLAVHAGWIHAKAGVAQVLLQRAFATGLQGDHTPPPWPWADTAPVARLRVDALGVDQIVLSGDDGRTLAFGPGWAPASALPGSGGTSVLSGHRDTHFAFLRELAAGSELAVQTRTGNARYRVAETRIADARHERLAMQPDHDELWLVTCWPFDAVVAGGPLRYLVRAERVPE